MKVTLKNVKINLTFSEETIMFKADFYIDGKKVGYCNNEGRGGSTSYHGYTREDYETIRKCEEYFKTLPKVTHTFDDGRTFDFQRTLDSEIDDIIGVMADDMEKKKFEKKMQKDMLTKLILSKGNPNQYETVGWTKITKKPFTIEEMLSHPNGKESLKKTIQNMKDKGYKILNTNIPKEFM